jgi:hypothetical protein
MPKIYVGGRDLAPLFGPVKKVGLQHQCLRSSVSGFACRADTVYQGDLLIILDACFSGHATQDLASALPERTAILTSSSARQTSQAITPPDGGPLTSAFTYVLTQILKGAPACDTTIDNAPICTASKGGVLSVSDLRISLKLGFRQLNLERQPDPDLKPFSQDSVGMVGYYCEAVRNINDNNRFAKESDILVAEALQSSMVSIISPDDALALVNSAGRLLATFSVASEGGLPDHITLHSLVGADVARTPKAPGPLAIVRLRPFKRDSDIRTESPGWSRRHLQ